MIDERFQYGPEEHSFYQEQGYTIFEHYLTPEALAACRANIDTMPADKADTVGPDELISTHQQEPWVYEMAVQPKLLNMLEQQIGPDILLWSTHLLCKPPHTGKMVPWHQDAPYWNVTGRFGAGVWIALDDMDEDNGAMSVIPGWHRQGALPVQASQFIEGFNQEIVPAALPDDVEQRRVAYTMRAGQMAIHDVMIPHNSPPNRSDRWRRALVLRYLGADGELGEKTYTNYKTGEPFEREYFLVRGRDVTGRGLRKSPFENVNR